MTYLEIIKFYYESGSGSGNEAPFYLRVKGKTVGGTYYKVTSWSPVQSSGAAAVSAITINLTATTSPDESQNVYLGDLVPGTDKNLTITAEEGGSSESDSKNYKEAEAE